MNADLMLLLAGAAIAAALMALAYAVLRRGQMEARATRDAALRRAANDTAAQGRVLGELDRHLVPLRRDLAARDAAVDAALAACAARLDAIERTDPAGARARLHALERRQAGASVGDPVSPPGTALSETQLQALSRIYWELEAALRGAEANLAAVPSGNAILPPELAQRIRDLPFALAETMPEDTGFLDEAAALLLDSVIDDMDRLRAGTGPANSGSLRRLLAGLIEDIRALMGRLERVAPDTGA